MRTLLLSLLGMLAACGQSPTLVIVERLAPGGGGAAAQAGPHFDILVRLEADATDFRAQDLMRVLVDGIDRTGEVVLGGPYGLLRISPPPIGARFVELFARTGPVVDTFTWNVAPFAGPTLSGVTPASARTGTQVTIGGAGFGGGTLRVFFGGVEGTVDVSSDTSITATVPDGAFPGLVYVLVGADAADGVVEFQPLDALDAPLPGPLGIHLFAAFPGHGAVETAVEIYGLNLDNVAFSSFNGRQSSRVFGVEAVELPLVGGVVKAFVVAVPETPAGAGTVALERLGVESNQLPFTVN